MKKLFLAICFSIFPMAVFAGVNEIFDPSIISNIPKQPEQKSMVVHDITPDELSSFLEDRLKNVVVVDKSQITQDNIAFEPSEISKQLAKQQNKSIYEKIYDNALARANSNKENMPTAQSWQENQRQQIDKFKGNLSTIDVIIPPYETPQTIAAVEHIPYLYNKIDVLPDGKVLFNEQLFILTEGKDEERGLTKKLPRYVYNRKGQKKEINYTLVEVTINGSVVDYKISEKNDEVWLEPKLPQNLEAGIYQYSFSFIANRLIDDYDNIKEFYWNLSGRGWDYIIAKMGASIHFPAKSKLLMAYALTGYGNNLQQDSIRAQIHDNNIISFTTNIPMFLKESMHLSAILQNDDAIIMGAKSKLSNFIDDNIEIIISLTALLFIAGAYILSWHSIKANKAKSVVGLKKTAQILRFLQEGKYDYKNFTVFLLDLYCRNIIDIQQAGESVILVKKTDNTKNLDKSHIKALNAIFGKQDAVFKVNEYNLLKLRRAAKYLKRGLQKQILSYILRANGAYFFLSLMMLFIAQSAIVYTKALGIVSFMLQIMLTFLTIVIGCFLFKKYKKFIIGVVAKLVSLMLIALVWILYSALLTPWASLSIISACLVIAYFTLKFSQRDGVMASILLEGQKQKTHLLKNKENLAQGKSFTNKQSMIFALDLEEEFADAEIASGNNKFSTMEQILKIMRL